MLKRTPIKKNRCKETGCENYPVMSLNGFCNDHADENLKVKRVSKHVQSKQRAAKRSQITRLIHLAQLDIKKPQIALKRQNKPIAKASKKRLAELKVYSVLRKDYLNDHPDCMAKLSVCKRKAVDVHHTALRGKNLNNVDTWISTCRECHNWIHTNSNLARELGLLK